MSHRPLHLPLVGAMVSLLSSVAVPLAQAETVSVTTFPDGTGVRKLSPVPAPGVHPRLFLSPEDLPTLRIEATTSPARKVHYANLCKIVAERLDRPTTPEGTVMALLAAGTMPSDAQFASTTELGYLLSLASIDAQVRDDAGRGAFLGRVLAAWGAYELKAWVRKPDLVGLHNSFDTGICLAYDFLASWMDEQQRTPVRRFIARMCDGIDIFTHDWPPHMRMWNWAGLHCYQGWGSLAIEGEEGWNPTLWTQAQEVARDFCRYNIHPSGALTEDLTYFTLGMQGSGLVLMAAAKRGQPEVWATTSNVAKLKFHLVNQLHPWGGGFMSHQDGGGNGFYATWTILKYMYPLDPMLDYAWRNRVGEDYADGGMANDASIRAWLMVLFNTEHLATPVGPEQWKLPNTYFCPDRSYLVTRTGWDKDALKLDFEAKTDYPTVGHNHADANNFTFAALGREWATEVGYHGAAGHLHNNVLIDGRSESGWPTPGGQWVDLVDTPEVTIGVSDARHPYTWQWANSGYGTENNPPTDAVKWERETLPEVLAFVRAQAESGKGRQTIFEHYGPVIRSLWNPVEKAFRTAALVRGKHPYALIVDDIRKDDAIHSYEWAMQMTEDVEVISSGGRWMILGAKTLPVDPKGPKDAKPQADKRRLLVSIVEADTSSNRDGMAIRLESTTLGNEAFESGKTRKRLVIPTRTSDPRFKVLLYPHCEGDALPDVLWNDEHTAFEVLFPGQRDSFSVAEAERGRSALAMARDGRTVAVVAAAPGAPLLRTTQRVFTDSCRIELGLPGPDQEIHYTSDGSDPTPTSTFYEGPFTISASTTIKAATFARRWGFGEQRRSAVTEARFTRQELRAAQPGGDETAGLEAAVYEGFWNELPDFSAMKPLFTAVVEQAQLPPGTPTKGFGVVLSGSIAIPADGVYAFGLECDDGGRIWIDDQLVADNDGQHVVRMRSGEIALKAGHHAIRIANCDGALALGTGRGDGSWAFKALWAAQGAALQEIPASALHRRGSAVVAVPSYPTVAARSDLRPVAGLEHATYDRSASVGTSAFLAVSGTPLVEDVVDNATTPDSSPDLLHVHRGYLMVSHAGLHEFRLEPSTVGEITIGGTVVARSGFPGSNVAAPVRLEAGPVPYQVSIGKGSAQVRWRGPGQSWQPVAAQDLVRELRPLATIEGRRLSRCGYELLGPTAIVLAPAVDGLQIRYTLDGSDPLADGKIYEAPLTVGAAATLRARFLANGTPVGAETAIRLTVVATPEQGLLGLWSAARFNAPTLANSRVGGSSDLVLPDGTAVISDPQQGQVLRFSHSSKVMLNRPGILANEATLSFRLKTASEAVLMRYGYAHTGIFLNLGKDGSMIASGGRIYRAAETKGVLADGQWHQVTATYGGSPFRVIEAWVDGVKLASGRSPAPCLTKELELLQGFTGELAEIRLYNRVLSQDEIASLTRGLGAAK